MSHDQLQREGIARMADIVPQLRAVNGAMPNVVGGAVSHDDDGKVRVVALDDANGQTYDFIFDAGTPLIHAAEAAEKIILAPWN